MVARPRLSVVVAPMAVADVEAVQAIELASFSAPWPPNAYLTELQTNRLAHYMVIRIGPDVVGYAGLWLMVDEAHVTTFAIHPDWRRRHLGDRLLLALLDIALDRRAAEATLEVRLSNLPARRLYEKFGFRPVGIRPRYYTDNQEDALIMTTERLDGPDMHERLARLRSQIDAAADPTQPADDEADRPSRVRPTDAPDRTG
jgi:[ribosomal protein S18]-alanine N-acetyltransferase